MRARCSLNSVWMCSKMSLFVCFLFSFSHVDSIDCLDNQYWFLPSITFSLRLVFSDFVRFQSTHTHTHLCIRTLISIYNCLYVCCYLIVVLQMLIVVVVSIFVGFIFWCVLLFIFHIYHHRTHFFFFVLVQRLSSFSFVRRIMSEIERKKIMSKPHLLLDSLLNWSRGKIF